MQKYKVVTEDAVVVGFGSIPQAEQFVRKNLPRGQRYSIFAYSEHSERPPMRSAPLPFDPARLGVRHGRLGPRMSAAAAKVQAKLKAAQEKVFAQPSYHELQRQEAARFKPKWKRR